MRALIALAIGLALTAPARAETATIAVATNFLPVAQSLGQRYAEASGESLTFVGGASGKLAAQIRAGAPFDLFLSADAEAPAALQADGLTVPGTLRTYAVGRLVLVAPKAAPDATPDAIIAGAGHVAIANPELAPYGRAAVQSLQSLGLAKAVEGKLVLGQNVGQAYALVESGAAEAGFVAVSAIAGRPPSGAAWPVPESTHDPIRQDAVLLIRGAENPAARGFLAFLEGPEARAAIAAAGYEAAEEGGS